MLGVPPLYADSSFENFDLSLNPTMQEALERCQAVAAGIALCALIVGDYGVGKTHLAVAALRASQWSKPGIYWESVTKFLDHLRQRSYGDGAEDIADVIRPYERGDFLLVLDDLGIEKRTEWSEDRLYQVLDSRYSWRLPTIITTNVDRERIDARIRSRFREGLVVCKGKDVRGKGAS
jgi:DNA replication protein DnaC